MKTDDIIEFLKAQNKELTSLLKDANEQIAQLTLKIAEQSASMSSIENAITESNKNLKKQKNINKGLGKLIATDSEQQLPELTEIEQEKLKEARDIMRKQRKNNGARRNDHPEMEIEEHIVYPDDPEFDIHKARIIGKKDENGEYPYRVSVRYECIPMRFIKHVYKIYTYSQGGKPYEGKAPKAAFLNSNYDASFIAGIMQLRYMYAMPVERIINYFEDNGFALSKPTAHGFLQKATRLMDNFYKAIRQVVLKENYICADETYYKILVPEKNSKGKGVRKGYFWVIIGVKTKLMYVLYQDGSRSQSVILNEMSDYKGTVQSDAFIGYKKLEGDDYPNIMRIACIQHIKRRFIDCGDDPDAKNIVNLINKLYQKEHKHRVGVDNWSIDDNLRYRQEYAPEILAEIRDELDRISTDKNILPKDELAQAVNYMLYEWDALVDIFSKGDTFLDNNLVERYNRYFSISRRNSLFFGSHAGAERGAILYTLSLSCKMNGINFFEYLTDIIAKTAEWQPNTPLEKYRELLPDRWIMKE